MLKIEIIRFQPQDIVTASCACSIHGCSGVDPNNPSMHKLNYINPTHGQAYCPGIDGSGIHTCGE